MPCGMKPSLSLTRGSIAQAPPSLPIFQRLMLSTPPPTTRSSKPLATLAAARFTLSRPDAQKRLCVTPATGLRPFGVEHRGARDVGALLADGRDAAEHHVVDQRRVELVAALQLLAAACAAATPAMAWCRLPSFLPLPRGVRRWS